MKKVLGLILLLLLGILIGTGIGVVIGMKIAGEKYQTEFPVSAPSVTPTITDTPILTVAPDVTATSTSTPSPTPLPAATSTPSPTPAPTATSTPSSTPVPTVTSTPSPTPIPTATSTPTPTATPRPSAPLDGFYGALHVEGTHPAAEDGTLVQLRGISTHGLGWFPDYVNQSMIAQARQKWGCNVFRLAMYTAEYNGYCTSGNTQKENLKNIIDIGVKAAVEQEMYVIIDWHILSDSNPTIYKEEAKKFFAEMAKKYADVPNVIYEICNEPNGGTSWSTIKQYALEVIPVIRENAPDAVIIVGTPTWSQDVDIAAQDPITEYDNIMYALHFYAATHKDSLRDKCKTAVAKGLPLFVTEYGICDASGNGGIDEASANKWIELLDGYGISHAMWNLSNKAETSAMIKSSCNKKNGLSANDLSAAGTWFVNMMKNAGLGSEDWVMPEAEESIGNGVGSNSNTGDAGNSDSNENSGQLPANIPTVEDLFEKSDNLELSVSNSWISENGYGIQLNVIAKNLGNAEETGWVRNLQMKDSWTITVSQCWCAKVKTEGDSLMIMPEDYNKNIPAGGEVGGIGIILEVK